jgi:hypothetical protein
MNSSMLQRIGWVLLTFCIPLYTQSQTKPVKKEPAGSISGKVSFKGKGAPGIIVGLRAADPYSRQTSFNKATTDQEGNYRITNVPPGTYQVLPAASAFLISGDRGGKTLLIAAGETVEGIDFTLNRGGVITGKAMDSEGRPLIEEHITLLAVEGTNQGVQHYMVAQMGHQTDDRGVYRIFGIPQGKYRVALGQGDDGFRARGARTSRYKQTFHPSVTEALKATVIEVSEGSEATNVDITVGRTLATFTASGRIVDGETGKPLANIKYGLQTLGNDRSSFVSGNLTSDGQGEFKLENLMPGKYAVFIVPQENGEMYADPVTFDLIDQDVTSLLLKTSPGASISGVVSMEGTNDRSVIARLGQMRIQTYVAKEGPGDSWIRPVTVNQEGGFRIGGLRGGIAQFSLTSSDGSQLRGFMLIRVERDGIAQPRGVEIKDGEQVTGVRLVVGYGNGTIRGLVKVENGELPTTARIGVWLTILGDDPANQRHLPSPNVDSRGRFIVEGLPAGNYEVNAAVYIPESRNAPPRVKQQVNVADGAVTEVTITIELNP